jgi:hypothetical protein
MLPRHARRLLLIVPGLLAGLGVQAMRTPPVRIEPGTAGWRRLVRGADDGVIRGRAVLTLPGVRRGEGDVLRLEAGTPEGATLAVTIDGGPRGHLRVSPGQPAVVPLPAARAPGLRVDLAVDDPGPARLRSLTVDLAPPSPWTALLAAILVAAATAAATSWGTRLALAMGLWAAGLLVTSATPALLFLTLPAAPSLLRLGLAATLAAGGVVLGLRHGSDRRRFAHGAAVAAAVVFGGWVRVYFLFSTGSWDTEYWKAWMLRAASHGITRVYGGPDAVPPGSALAQLSGEEDLWKVSWGGRDFVVDYPPLAMALWRWSWWAVVHAAPALDYTEAQNAAVKLPAVAGDLVAVWVLLWALRDRPRRAVSLAALYWVLPVSWLSSAVLGFLDGAVAPFAAAALVAAGRGGARVAGALVAVACLIKPTAVVVAPAVAVALWNSRASIRRAVAAGAAVVAVALAPYALDGTLTTAVVHVYRILFQGTLSGGFPNPWWLLGHALTVAEGGADPAGPVRFARLDLLDVPARSLGAILFASAAVFVVWRQRRAAGTGAASLAGAALVFAYGMLAVGVHENHPHPLFLALLATGLATGRLMALAAGAATVYVLNMLCLSGLGRFHGLRYAALEGTVQAVAGLRMSLGFDFTLALAVVNLVLFAGLLAGLAGETARLARVDPGAA